MKHLLNANSWRGSKNFTNGYCPILKRRKLGLHEVNCSKLQSALEQGLDTSWSEPRACAVSHQQIPPTPKNSQDAAPTTAKLSDIQGHPLARLSGCHGMPSLTYTSNDPADALPLPGRGQVREKPLSLALALTAIWGDSGQCPTTKKAGLGCR